MYGYYQNPNSGASAPPHQGAPPPGYQGAPPSGYQGAPPSGYQGAPPSGYQGAPSTQYQAGRPYQGAPPPQYNQYGAQPQQQPQRYSQPQQNPHQQQPPPQQQGQADLWGWFCTVDTDRSGKISSMELQQALSNGFEKFNLATVQLLMNLFDNSNSGQMVFDDFRKVFDFITQWSRVFQQYDSDRSGAISFNELKTALSNFGYRLSDRFYNIIFSRFAKKETNEVTFDNFIRICVVLNNVTRNFQSLDTNRTGSIQISYEQFVEILFAIV
ncbi:programmed cell death protein 6-like [Symsagittifera roscoffensis]|uniref:programmed cell death protein 6-like n=1 Tax=Symsagittifera roscoffensis TaxID=84072 RepID=UPI00307C24FB